jgi:hypothetical protein
MASNCGYEHFLAVRCKNKKWMKEKFFVSGCFALFAEI